MNRLNPLFLVPTIFVLVLAACGGAAPTEEIEAPQEPTAAAVEPTAEVEVPTETAQVIEGAWVSQFEPLPAAPQEVSIPTVQGRELAGMYFPAKVNPAPIVVLMHWAGGDMTDWRAIAPWLQNRADELSRKGGFARPIGQIDGPWLDASWFPALLPEASFGVLVFDYGGFGESPLGDNTDLEDSVAALEFASKLEGADPNMLLTMGASIGADGAVDACYVFNELVTSGEAQGQCLAAMSLSPGNYFMEPFGTADFTYAEAVAALSEAEHLVFCLAAEGDSFSAEVCLDAQADFYTAFIYAGDNHGMMLVDPTLSPSDPAMDVNALELLLDFLAMSIGRNVTP